MAESQLDRVRIVMVYTSHPGNIGAAARAMKNMGLSKLVLVSPNCFPSYDAYQRAAGADDILNEAVVVNTLDEALRGCVFVAGTSARSRSLERQLQLPRQCAEHALLASADGDVAIVFGRERNGLSNDELDRCNALVHIPTSAAYNSLNVASAVQILCYELRNVALAGANDAVIRRARKHAQDAPASQDELQGLYDHLFDTLRELQFFGRRDPVVTMRRIKALFNRAAATRREVAIFRGICSAVQGRKLGGKKPG